MKVCTHRTQGKEGGCVHLNDGRLVRSGRARAAADRVSHDVVTGVPVPGACGFRRLRPARHAIVVRGRAVHHLGKKIYCYCYHSVSLFSWRDYLLPTEHIGRES